MPTSAHTMPRRVRDSRGALSQLRTLVGLALDVGGATTRSCEAALAEVGVWPSSRSWVSRWREGLAEATEEHLAVLLEHADWPAVAAAAAQLAGGTYLAPSVDGSGSLHEALAASAAAHGRTTSTVLEAMADGRVTSEERAAVVAELDREAAALAQLRARIGAAGGRP